MIPEEKITEIKKNLRRGYPRGELINELINEGYTSHEIQFSLFSIAGLRRGPGIEAFPFLYMTSICFIIPGIAILSVKFLWLYYCGYVFLILGLIGLVIKICMPDPGKK